MVAEIGHRSVIMVADVAAIFHLISISRRGKPIVLFKFSSPMPANVDETNCNVTLSVSESSKGRFFAGFGGWICYFVFKIC